MRLHFRDRHTDDTIVVEQQGCFPTRCVSCNMFARTVGTTRQATKMCKDEGKRRVHSQWKANRDSRGVRVVLGKGGDETRQGRTSSDEKPGASEGEVRHHEEVPSQRRGRSLNNGDVLQDSGSLRATLWQRILGADRRFDEATPELS
jgi:hypothetical protein